MSADRRLTPDEARRWMGQPVCVVLKDGSYYVGWITEVEQRNIVLSGSKGRGKLSASARRQAETARLNGLFPQMFGGGAPGGGAGFPFGNHAPAGGFPGGMFGQANAGGGGGLGGGGLGGGGLGGGGIGGGLGGGGLMGMVGKIWPGIRMGIGIVQMIMPLLGGLKI